MDPLLGVFRHGKLTRVASVKDNALRRSAFRAFAEPQSHIVVDVPSSMVSSNIKCVDAHLDADKTHFQCALLDTGADKYIPVYATGVASRDSNDDDIDLTWHVLAVSTCVFTRAARVADVQVTLLGDGCLALKTDDMVYRSRASAHELTETLPLSTHDDTQLLSDEINDNGAWGTEDELKHRLASRTRSAIRAEHIMEELKHVMLTPGFTSCFSLYDASYARALGRLMKLNNERALVQDTAFCAELFARTTSVMVRAMAMPVPVTAFHPTKELTLTERVRGGNDCQPHKWLRWYMRLHARLQRDFQARLKKSN